MTRSSPFRASATALVRAVANGPTPVASYPAFDDDSPVGVAAQLAWLRSVWSDGDVVEAIRHASPPLAGAADGALTDEQPQVRDVQRIARSVARYILRAHHRATPFGLFAGVTGATLGAETSATWGEQSVAVPRASAEWLAAVTDRLESSPELIDRLSLVVNNTAAVRGDSVIAPFQADEDSKGPRAVEASIVLTNPIRTVLANGREPIRGDTLVELLRERFPHVEQDRVRSLLVALVRRHVLITNLRAPSTETDALGHLLDQLHASKVGEVASWTDTVRQLHRIASYLNYSGRAERDTVAARMRSVAPGLRRHPLAIDLRLDGRLGLPAAVAREVERAALVLTRLTPRPYGTAAWKEYHQRFYERYGVGTLVPLLDVLADSGIGYPDGYPGTPEESSRPRVSARDDVLVRVAQAAALDGRQEVVLTDMLIAELDVGPGEIRWPPHLEIGVRVLCAHRDDLTRGRFRVQVVSVSRGAGVSTGRFLPVLSPADRDALADELTDLPVSDADTVAVQLSFPPLLSDTAHVTRAPHVLPLVLSMQEHRDPSDTVLTPRELAVGCDGRRLYLAAPQRGHRVEVVAMNALNLHAHTPPLARYLIELSRAQCAQVTTFDWGVAGRMPFLPRLRLGRTVLAPAQWRLDPAELSARDRSPDQDAMLDEWRTRRRVPSRVYLGEDDRHLFLDLDDAGHRSLLRHHLAETGTAVLREAPAADDFGWCDGRAHEVVVPVMATRPSIWPPLPVVTTARVFTPATQRQAPGTSAVLLASVYGDPRRQDLLLARHVPELLERLGGPDWWFVRFRDPGQHLRLRIALPDPEAFAETARTISLWADELRQAGLVADLRYPTSYCETGRWGDGPAWDAAEQVFRADSRAVVTQLGQPHRPTRRTLVAAHTVSIARAFLGSTEAATRWLIDHLPATAPERITRPEFTDAVRLADPEHDWTALRAEPGGDAIVSGWSARDEALVAYRQHLPGPHTRGIAVDDVLTSLLHVHFVRHVAVNFPEEQVCLYLARAAALSRAARTTNATTAAQADAVTRTTS